ncbi:MAG: hypothetical protein AAFP90_10855 [Planctomycetota bacterium]
MKKREPDESQETDSKPIAQDGWARMIYGALGMMVDQLVLQANAEAQRENDGSADETPPREQLETPPYEQLETPPYGQPETHACCYGLPGFDERDWQEKLWMLHQIAQPLAQRDLLASDMPPPTAFRDATLAAVMAELFDQVQMELLIEDDPQTLEQDTFRSSIESHDPSRDPNLPTWRQSVVAGCRCLLGPSSPLPDASLGQPLIWEQLLERIASRIVGPPWFRMVESLGDGDPSIAADWLASRGLPGDYIHWLPPYQTIEQSQQVIDQLQKQVFGSAE